MTTDHTYKVIELVGTSPEGVEQAIENAISRAGPPKPHHARVIPLSPDARGILPYLPTTK